MRDDVPLMFPPILINIFLSDKCIDYIQFIKDCRSSYSLTIFFFTHLIFFTRSSYFRKRLISYPNLRTRTIITSLYLLNCFSNLHVKIPFTEHIFVEYIHIFPNVDYNVYYTRTHNLVNVISDFRHV
jgi:hypothetical protein